MNEDSGSDDDAFVHTLLADPRTETRSMRAVSRAILRAQTRALIFERLKAVTAELFRGTETRPAKLLLKVPGAGAFPAEFDDVVEIENELAEFAAMERAKIGRLLGSGVLADPVDVDRRPSLATPHPKPPLDEGVEANPQFSMHVPGGKSAR